MRRTTRECDDSRLGGRNPMGMSWQGAELELADGSPQDGCALQWREEAGYLQRGSDQIYCVRHEPEGRPVASILMAGSFAYSRERAYISWVRWARFLARHGLEVLRFDYRGTGESSRNLEETDLDVWLEDTRCCAQWLMQHGEGRPLVLHGYELGALLMSNVFVHGTGEALLMWSPPASARDILTQALQLHRIQQYALRRQPGQVPRADAAAELEAGRPVVLSGCTITPHLWRQSTAFVLADIPQCLELPDKPCSRRHKAVHLDPAAGPLCLSTTTARSAQTGVGQLNPNLGAFFEENLDWIHQCLADNRRSCATHHPH